VQAVDADVDEFNVPDNRLGRLLFAALFESPLRLALGVRHGGAGGPLLHRDGSAVSLASRLFGGEGDHRPRSGRVRPAQRGRPLQMGTVQSPGENNSQ
jgi:hypothetical protein